MTIEAWYMDNDTTTDQRMEHRQNPNVPVDNEELLKLGVLTWNLKVNSSDDNLVDDDDIKLFEKIKMGRGYNYQDIITVSPNTLENYEMKIKSFFEEHIHTDEEIRFILNGSGYFDVRDLKDNWIRIALGQGDMITLPAGIYHRFTLDDKNFVKAMRLFIGEPIWTPHNRPQEGNEIREKYVDEFGAKISVV